LARVDLPAPLAPTIAEIDPSLKLILKPSRIFLVPFLRDKFFTVSIVFIFNKIICLLGIVSIYILKVNFDLKIRAQISAIFFEKGVCLKYGVHYERGKGQLELLKKGKHPK